MNTPIDRYCNFLLGNRLFVIVACLLASVFMLAGGYFLSFSSDYQDFFSDENPQLAEFEAVQNTYSRSDNILIMLVPDEGDVFTPRRLKAIHDLSDEAWTLPYASRVDSITNFQHSYGRTDEIVIEDLFSPDDDDVARIRTIALSEPLLVNRLVSPSADATAVNITFSMPGENVALEYPLVVAEARAMVDAFQQRYPDIRLHMSGMVMLDNALAESTITDLLTLVPLVYVLVALGVAIFLRSFYLSAATVALVTLSICCAMGVAGWMGVVLTPPSASVPPIIMTLAVADCLHILTTFQQKRSDGLDRTAALTESIRINLSPVFLTSVTTAIGFLTLNMSDVPPYRDLGNITALGVVFALIFSITFLPALVSYLPLRDAPSQQRLSPKMLSLARFVVTWRKPLLCVGFGLIIICAAFLPRNALNDNFVEYFDSSVTFRSDTDRVTEALTGIYFTEYSLHSGETDGITEPAFLAAVDQFSRWLGEQPEVLHVDSIVEIIKRLNYNLRGDDPAYYRLPDDKAQIAQYLLLYEMSLPNGLSLNSQINVDKSATRIVASTKTLSTTESLAFEQRASSWLATNLPQLTASGVSPTLMFSHISLRNSQSILLGTTVALLLISAFLILPFRSARHGLISLVSNVAPACVAFGVWAMTIGQVSVGVSIVVAMTLGIVVDDTIHMLSKYLRARREMGLNPVESIHYAFSTVGVALLGTTAILTVGFLVMAQSAFQINSHMGILSAITVVVALLIDLLLLPPLLMLFDRDSTDVGTAELATTD